MSEKRAAAVQLVPNGANKRLKVGDYFIPIEAEETELQKLKTDGFDPVTLLSLRPLPQPTPGITVLYTPMAHFCAKGDLGMCQYLIARGVDCTERSGFHGTFPMHEAAMNGHLDLCKWMYKHGGAREDIRGTLGSGSSASLIAKLLRKPQDDRTVETWKWFIMKGALWGEIVDDSGQIDDRMMRQVIPPSTYGTDVRPQLLEWVQTKVQIHRKCLHVFLGGTLSNRQSSSQDLSPLHVLGGKEDILEMIADYAGLRMFRHFADRLSVYIQDTPCPVRTEQRGRTGRRVRTGRR